jgi:hypothetical protein
VPKDADAVFHVLLFWVSSKDLCVIKILYV